MVEEDKSLEGQKAKMSGAKVVIIIVAVAILIYFFWGFGTAIHLLEERHNRGYCMSNLHKLAIGFKLYAEHNGERYPTPKEWCDLLRGELAEDCNDLYICPSKISSGERCSYVMNPNAEPNLSPGVVLLFEGSGGWNQVGGVELANVDNHDPKGCSVLFCDYSIRIVQSEKLDKLRWK